MSTISIDLDETPTVQFTESQREVYKKMIGIIGYFFTRAGQSSLRPFRGFLLEGPPASGKTELAIQVAKTIKSKLARARPPHEVVLHFIDSSVIAAPHWGEAERRLAKEFPTSSREQEKHVLLVDDIDCLMITRGAEIAKEWHYSINSVIFHRLDFMDPTKAIVIATTNKSQLIDDALRSRLYTFQVSLPRKDELLQIARHIAVNLGLGERSDAVAAAVLRRLKEIEQPTLRHVQHFLIEECVESGLWGVEM